MRNIYARVFLFVILCLVGLFFFSRNFILRRILTDYSEKVSRLYDMHIHFTDARFSGLKSVYIFGLEVTSLKGDTILKADTLEVSPRLLPLLTGQKRLSKLSLYNADARVNMALIRLWKDRHGSHRDSTVQTPTSFAELLNDVQKRFFTLIPSRIAIRNSAITYIGDSVISSVYCRSFSYQGENFTGDFVLSDNSVKQACHIQGFLDRGDSKLTATISHSGSSIVQIPYINARWQTLVGFDTLAFAVSFKKIRGTLTDVTGQASASHLVIKHKRIGPDQVITQSCATNFTVHVGERYAELDSSSMVRINKFSFSPYLRFQKDSTRRLSLSFIRKEFEGQELFESLPTGLFSSFDGLKTKGRLAYHLKIAVDFDRPDSVIFESKLENKGFSITQYGSTDFRIINGTYTQDIYDNDRFVKSVRVGEENPDFVPLQQISPYFRNSVLTAEDGDFFYHHGFNERAFRESVATNLKEQRFARGGSTISMQLVKNVFLSRNKTVSRKVEEALIVWMIENLRLVSKERMYEVYLNIIELGPGVYGIKPASRFYFNKLPSALSLSESIFLASIIPRPKGFRYAFVSNGVLRDYLASYYKLLGGIMVRRNQLSSADTARLSPHVKLTGEARKMLAKPDSTAKEDSLFFGEPKTFYLN
jgi:hypothetical protein